jgi:hypothetical protein
MTRQRFLTILLALSCMTAVGFTATTLESSLSTDPDDVIDVNYKYLPIGEEPVKDVKRQAIRNEQNAPSSADSSSSPPAPESMFGVFGKLLALLLLLVALGLAYRYRHHMFALVLAIKDWFTDRVPTHEESGGAVWPSRQPSNDVDRAWLAMVKQANPDRPWSRTPAECAQAAVDAGMNAEAVSRLTTLFEEVRYGDAPVTDERRQRAREWFERLDDRRRSDQ